MTIEGLIVRGTSAREDDSLGDGIVVGNGHFPAEVTITGTIVEKNARAGLGSWGAPVRFAWNVLSCNAFDLQGEVYEGSPFAFPDSHDNLCGCPTVTDNCNALRAHPGISGMISITSAQKQWLRKVRTNPSELTSGHLSFRLFTSAPLAPGSRPRSRSTSSPTRSRPPESERPRSRLLPRRRLTNAASSATLAVLSGT